MSSAKRAVTLFTAGAVLWVLHLAILAAAADRDPVLDQSSPLLAAALANLAFWLGVLSIGAGLLLLVLTWSRRDEETGRPEASVDHYA